jgi:hypothetical protein
VGTSTSDSSVSRDNTQFLTGGFISGGIDQGGVSINATTYDIQVNQDNETGSTFSEFIYWSSKTPAAGKVVVSDTRTVPANSTSVFSYGPGLTSPNIMIQTYEVVTVSGTNYYRPIIPDSINIYSGTTVQVTYVNGTSSPVQVFAIFSVVGAGQTIQGKGNGGTGPLVVSIPNPPTSYMFVSCYTQLDSYGDLTAVFPDSVVYTEFDNTTRVTFNSGLPNLYNLYWEPAQIVSNRVKLTSIQTPSSAFLDTSPQLTLWGLDQGLIYSKQAQERAGWVTHLDTYRSAGNNFLVSGLGGNLFSGRDLSDQERISWLVPTLYPNLNNRVGLTSVCGPCFVSIPEVATATRTGGVIGGTTWGSGFAYSTSITYADSFYTGPNGFVDVLLQDTQIQVSGTPIIDGQDKLTIENAGNEIHNGSWTIVSHTIDLVNNQVTLRIQNPKIAALAQESPELLPISGPTQIWNSTTGAKCGIFSGALYFYTDTSFRVGDILLNENLPAGTIIDVTNAGPSYIYANNFYENVTFPVGTLVLGERTSRVLPLRRNDFVAFTDNVVGGDNLQIGTYTRQFKVLSINPLATVTVEIDGLGDHSVIRLSSGTTSGFSLGDWITLVQAGEFTGDWQVTGIPNGSTLTIAAASNNTAYLAKLVGNTVALDEVITWQDDAVNQVEVSVPSRWLPLEAPDHVASSAPTTYTRYLSNSDYDNQPILRSSQVSDTLFLNNGNDRTLKIDGQNLYRPGLPRWQAQLFFSQATAPNVSDYETGTITPIYTTCAVAGWANNSFNVAATDVYTFTVGTRVSIVDTVTSTGVSTVLPNIYTVTQTDTNSLTGGSAINEIFVDKQIIEVFTSGHTYKLTTLSTYSYYFRLNAIDLNNNVIASAVTGSNDCTINVSAPFQNRIRLVGLPTLDIYDYDRLEVQIYRTAQNGVAPYYLVSTLAIPFGQYQGYIDYIDTAPDSTLAIPGNVDPVTTNLKGQELGTGWSQPVRAKHVTSAANRLILGNLTSDPFLDFTIRNIGAAITGNALDKDRYLLRKSDQDTGLLTDMVNRIGFEFKQDTLNTITDLNYGVLGPNIVQVTVSTPNSLLTAGDWVYLFSDRTLPDLQTHLMGWFQINQIQSTTKFSFYWIPNILALTTFANSYTATANFSADTFTPNLVMNVVNGQKVRFSTTGTMPAGLTAGIDYFVVNAGSSTFQVSSTLGGTPVNFTTNGTGTLSYTPTFLVSSEVNRVCTATDPTDVPVYIGTDYNYQTSNGQPGTDSLGTLIALENLASRRLANAVNATQRMVDLSLPGMAGFKPWVLGNAGGEYAVGQILFTQPMNQATTMSLQMPAVLTGYSAFVNGLQRSPGEEVSAHEEVYPSRILVSYPNFPEIFDSPFSSVDSQSDSAIDINPADGQEITAVLPFFGSSAFGAALKDAVVVVFKTNSIYVVNLAAKAAGQVSVQRIESQGLGCTAPYSVAPVRDGIMFANASGIYKLRTDLSVYYMGRHMQRQWRTRVNLDGLDLVFGHNWSFGSQYKLSLPTDSSLIPNEAFVYNSTREYTMEGVTSTIQLYSTREGSWTRHNGFSAIGWCNLDADSFYANLKGQVMQLRRTGETSDWRDDSSPIQMDVLLRAFDFGDDGVRKTVPYALVSYRNPPSLGIREGTQVLYATDLQDSFLPADVTVLPNRAEVMGMDDSGGQKVVTLRYSFGNKRGIRFQLRFQNSVLDESVEITKIRYSVAGLSIKGTEQAAQSPGFAKN